MIALSFPHIALLKQTHFNAVKSYVCDTMHRESSKDFYAAVTALPGFEMYPQAYDEHNDNYDWLEQFILADFTTLESWTKNSPQLLSFLHMKKLYLNRFAKGPNVFVDSVETYNSYTLFDMMDISVCPYCEHEFLNEVDVHGNRRRTMEFDHYFPKGDNEYPGLAMCFFNLIPSCIPCNRLKMTQPLAASPYTPNIEALSYFETSVPLGSNMESVAIVQCEPKLNATGGMALNNVSLAIEQRYRNLASEVHHLLTKKQNHTDEKLREMERCGFGSFSQLKVDLFGNPRSQAKGKELHTKMKEDLIGY